LLKHRYDGFGAKHIRVLQKCRVAPFISLFHTFFIVWHTLLFFLILWLTFSSFDTLWHTFQAFGTLFHLLTHWHTFKAFGTLSSLLTHNSHLLTHFDILSQLLTHFVILYQLLSHFVSFLHSFSKHFNFWHTFLKFLSFCTLSQQRFELINYKNRFAAVMITHYIYILISFLFFIFLISKYSILIIFEGLT